MLGFSENVLGIYLVRAQLFHAMFYMPHLLMIVSTLVDGESVCETLQGYVDVIVHDAL